LKKRTKKLLLDGVRGPVDLGWASAHQFHAERTPRMPTDKSFLVLFFKKELLP
jgi:hypothetical protein